jgi:hypothetical protein
LIIDLDPFFRRRLWAMTLGLFYVICGLFQILSLGCLFIMELPADTIFFPDVVTDEENVL